jgi:hypothetical protein
MFRSRWRDTPRPGPAGRDADPVDADQIVNDLLERVPKPENGKDADPKAITDQIREAVGRLHIPKDGEPGKRGPKGPKGDKGDEGEIGPRPRHEWKETELRFEKADGTWGKFVDLRGPPGLNGGGGIVQIESDAPPFDIDSLPIGDTSTPEEIVVKQHGIWVRITWDQFMDMVGVPQVPLDLSLDGDLLSLDGDQLSLT